MSIQKPELDDADRKIVNILKENADITSNALGEIVNLSASATNERIRKLKSEGIIKKIIAQIDASALGMQLGAFIFVLVCGKKRNENFLENTVSHQNILECHHVTGDYSYLLKVRLKNTKALENFMTDFIKAQPGVIRTTTQIIMHSTKDSGTAI
ncbi:MAG: Lrp/AsnC family transcriptional regulator [Rickettsiales bacterium]